MELPNSDTVRCPQGCFDRAVIIILSYTTFIASLPSVLLLRAVRLNLELAEVRRTHWVPLKLILEA